MQHYVQSIWNILFPEWLNLFIGCPLFLSSYNIKGRSMYEVILIFSPIKLGISIIPYVCQLPYPRYFFKNLTIIYFFKVYISFSYDYHSISHTWNIPFCLECSDWLSFESSDWLSRSILSWVDIGSISSNRGEHSTTKKTVFYLRVTY